MNSRYFPINEYATFIIMRYFLLIMLYLIYEVIVSMRIANNAAKAQRDLLVTVAHELKTPMGVVMLYGEKMERGGVSAMRENARALQEEIKRMNGRLMDVLTVARQGNMPAMPLEPLALNKLLEDICDEFLPLTEEKEIFLQMEIAPDSSVSANAFYIHTAIHNFLSNAVKFTPRGGRVAVRLERGHNTARVSVWNSGSPIDGEDEKKIRGSFYKVSDGGDNKNKGTGLGLPIVRGIIQNSH